MNQKPDYIIDIDGLQTPASQPPTESAHATLHGRPWLAVHWRCCGVYSRIYRSSDGSRYSGRCPRCGRPVVAKVGPGGTSSRFFEAS